MQRTQHSNILANGTKKGNGDSQSVFGNKSIQGTTAKKDEKSGDFEGDFFKDFYYSQGNYDTAKCQEKIEKDKTG